jgi:hypothetical protein
MSLQLAETRSWQEGVCFNLEEWASATKAAGKSLPVPQNVDELLACLNPLVSGTFAKRKTSPSAMVG